MYAVGIDIGTTFTAAAVWRDGRAEIAPLDSHSAAIPSVLFLLPDGTFLTGESAGRRGLGEPNRVAREFKRRLGDTTPLLLGGAPYSAVALTARMLRSVLDAVSAREGGRPDSICVSHPASWGPYQKDLMRQVVRLADIDQPVRLTTDAQAAATFHAHQQPLDPGAVVAVYDLGGGSLGVTALRKTSDGFDIIGEPEGIESVGGIEFDAAIFAHVAASAGGALEKAGKTDPAVARLRQECVRAKEALSADTDATIQVLLPTVRTEVRLTRSELETLVRPALDESIEALRRAIRSAGYAPQALGTVLLMGGSSRMPIVARMVGEELGRPVAVDADPKHAVALGAAWQAGNAIAAAGPAAAPVTEPADPMPEPDERTGHVPVLTEPTEKPVRLALFTGRVAIGPGGRPAPWLLPQPAQPAKPARRRAPILAAVAAILLLTAGGAGWALTRPGGPDTAALAASRQTAPAAATGERAAAPVPADQQCTDAMKKSTRWVCLTKATLHDNKFTLWYQAEWNGTVPDIQKGFHLHIYGGDGAHPDESTMGSQAVQHSKYYFEDKQPSVRRASDADFQAIGDATKVCARIAESGHGLAKASDGSYHTGNCIPIRRY